MYRHGRKEESMKVFSVPCPAARPGWTASEKDSHLLAQKFPFTVGADGLQ